MLAEPLLFIPAAFLAGVLMFLAPCTLPIVPGYLAFIAGGEKRVLRNAVAFVLGFSIVFILLGSFAGLLGGAIGPWRDTLSRAAGALIILFGITMLGVWQVPFLAATRNIRLPKFLTLGRPESSALIGALFALGWSPCIGPILGTILLVASTGATAWSGALLLAAFSLGLAVPFLLCAIFIERVGKTLERFVVVSNVLSRVGAVVLIVLGVLMLTGNMALLVAWGFGFFDFLGYGSLLNHL